MAAGDAVLRAVDERETLEASQLLMLCMVLLHGNVVRRSNDVGMRGACVGCVRVWLGMLLM